MARCGCPGGCACAVQGGLTESVATSVAGVGSAGVPYEVTADVVLVPDGEGPLAPDQINQLKVATEGLYVSPAGGCECSSLRAELDAPTDLVLAAGTEVEVNLAMTLVAAVTSADWTAGGGGFQTPNGTAWHVGFALRATDGSGTDAVQLEAYIGEFGQPTAANSLYLPAGFPVGLAGGQLSASGFHQLYTSATETVKVTCRLAAPASATRTITVEEAVLWAVKTCDCPAQDMD